MTVSWRGHELMNCFCDSNMGKLWPKFSSVQVGPVPVVQMKKWIKFTKSSTKPDEVPFRNSLAGQAFHMEHVTEL